MSAQDYGYEDYEQMFRHAEHHGGGIDADSNVVEQVVYWLDELAALRATVETQAATIALNKYVTPPFDLTDEATVKLALECAAKDEIIAQQAAQLEQAYYIVFAIANGDNGDRLCEIDVPLPFDGYPKSWIVDACRRWLEANTTKAA